MNIVIPHMQGSRNNYAELRYALRSFEKFIPNINDIYIIGHLPDWAKGMKFIQFRDDAQPKFKEANVYLKLKYYIDKIDSQKDFIYANDDHFLLREFEHGIPHKGTIKIAFDKRKTDDPYRKTIKNTIDIIGASSHNFDVHCPMVVHPSHFLEAFKKVDWSKPFGYLMKSIYYKGMPDSQNIWPCDDVKINRNMDSIIEIHELVKGQPFFSTSDFAFDSVMEDVLQKVFPKKSKWER